MKLIITIWEKWKALGLKVVNFLARSILTITYFSILLPIGLIASRRVDSFQAKKARLSIWVPWLLKADTLNEVKNQF